MIRTTILAAATLLLTTPATAQSTSQSELDARYDRALAAGYKALFLCSAIANAERNGATRTPESVMEWELTGIQAPLDEIVGELVHWPYRDRNGEIYAVAVEWTNDMAPRIALHQSDRGCSIQPIGYDPAFLAMEEEPNGEFGNQTTIAPSHPEQDQLEPTLHFTLQGDASPLREQQANDPVSTVLRNARSDTYGVDSRSTVLLVAKANREWGYAASGWDFDTPQRTWSVAKSIAATLVGAAVHRGEVAVTDSAGLGESEDDPRTQITIDEALRMATGRYSDTPGNRTDPLYFGGATVDEVAVDWPLIHEPGTVFRYANNDTLAAVQAIEHTFAAHPPSELFASLNMSATVAETDWQGNYILSSQVWSTARDLARLGQLYLDDGVLPDGTRILPEGWVEYVSTPSGPQPGNTAWGYGAGWWIMGGNIDGIPGDAFAARGNRGQYIVVIPSRDVVIVRRGEDPAGGSGFDIVAFTRDVLAALEQ